VHPEEVERVLRELPDVIDASVIGMPCPTRGEMLVACVRRRGAMTAAHIRSECAARLAPHKIPRRIVFTEGLPTDALGKTDGRALELLVRRTFTEEGEEDFE
jgi:acyl-CoA synthetase (AMP-forming)/AMP-acid ligase II